MPPSERPPRWTRYRRFFGPDVDGDIDEELAFHFAERVDALRAEGRTTDDARRQAFAEFGNVRDVRAALRSIDRRMDQRRARGEWLANLGARVRHAVRVLVRQPGFTIPAVVTLALGLASTVAIYTLLDTIVLRPLPFPNAERLVAMSSPMPKLDDTWGIARHQLFYYERNARAIERMALYRTTEATLIGDGDAQFAERVRTAWVSASIFDVLGIVPQLGRTLVAGDNAAPVPASVVISDELWTRRFGGERAIIGRTINIEGLLMQVVGVAPPRAQLPDHSVDIWIPDEIDPAATPQNNHIRDAVARLRAGYTAAATEAEIRPLVARMGEVFPSAYPNGWIEKTGFRTAVVPLRDEVIGPTIARTLWILLAGVGLVLAVALANVANLFLVRADGRRREVLVRSALGARRGDLLKLHLTDALVVALAAATLAYVLLRLSLGALVWIAPEGVPRLAEVHVGLETVALLAAGAVAIGVALGLIATRATRGDHATLRDASHGLTLTRPQVMARGALVVAQVSLAVVLLAGAGLMMRSFQKLRAIDPGFQPDGLIAMDVSLPAGEYREVARVSAFYEQLLGAVRGFHGVTDAGIVEQLPLTGRMGCTGVVTNQPSEGGQNQQCVATLQTSPGFFETMRVRMRGAGSTWDDVHRASGGVVVTRALAEILWPGEDPMGRTIRCCSNGDGWFRVSGVIDKLYDAGLDAPPMQAAFFPLVPVPGAELQWLARNVTLVVRAPAADPASLFALVRREVARIDARAPVTDPRPVSDVVLRSMARRTFALTLLGAASAIALLLSAIGLYAVISYVVSQRVGEIGIRMALGAGAGTVARMVVTQSLVLAALGIGVGVAAALSTTRVLGSLLYEVRPSDPIVFVGVSVLLVVIAVAASLVPTWRAAHVDPARTLRDG